jgi:uncharacterized protein YwgA
MKLKDVLVIIFGELGGSIQSKTKIQKICYFISVLTEKDFGYKAHYYGPYSEQVASALDELVGIGFVSTTTNTFGMYSSDGFEIVRYDYTLTEQGKQMFGILNSSKDFDEIKGLSVQLEKMKGLHYVNLSIAAKAYFVLKKQGQPMTNAKIRDKAKTFGWNIADPQIDSAITFLENMDLVKRKASGQ